MPLGTAWSPSATSDVPAEDYVCCCSPDFANRMIKGLAPSTILDATWQHLFPKKTDLICIFLVAISQIMALVTSKPSFNM